jgi:hypothetical protein
MSEPDRGLYEKYIVRRSDGADSPGGRHDGCRYFVLDLDCDPYALPAIVAYFVACQATHPLLALDLATIIASKKRQATSA